MKLHGGHAFSRACRTGEESAITFLAICKTRQLWARAARSSGEGGGVGGKKSIDNCCGKIEKQGPLPVTKSASHRLISQPQQQPGRGTDCKDGRGEEGDGGEGGDGREG